jgi:hypothetical protein
MAGLMRETIEKDNEKVLASSQRRAGTKYDYSSSARALPARCWPSAFASQHGARVLVIDKRPHIAATPMTISTRRAC